MITDSLKVNRLKSEQYRLYSFLDTTSDISGGEIRQWISECVVHFTEVGVPSNIISFFLERLDYKDVKSDGFFESSGSHGPFIYNAFLGGYYIDQENRLNRKSGGQTKMTPILVAFKVAENLIDKYADTLRLIPNSLIDELNRYNETKTISVSLSAVESAYRDRDTKKILTALISTTDSVLMLIPELLDKAKLGPRIRKAYETREIYEKYSISREVLWSLNNARIIRNIDTHNPNSSNETPIFEAVSYSHLLILLIISIINSGKITLTET